MAHDFGLRRLRCTPYNHAPDAFEAAIVRQQQIRASIRTTLAIVTPPKPAYPGWDDVASVDPEEGIDANRLTAGDTDFDQLQSDFTDFLWAWDRKCVIRQLHNAVIAGEQEYKRQFHSSESSEGSQHRVSLVALTYQYARWYSVLQSRPPIPAYDSRLPVHDRGLVTYSEYTSMHQQASNTQAAKVVLLQAALVRTLCELVTEKLPFEIRERIYDELISMESYGLDDDMVHVYEQDYIKNKLLPCGTEVVLGNDLTLTQFEIYPMDATPWPFTQEQLMGEVAFDEYALRWYTTRRFLISDLELIPDFLYYTPLNRSIVPAAMVRDITVEIMVDLYRTDDDFQRAIEQLAFIGAICFCRARRTVVVDTYRSPYDASLGRLTQSCHAEMFREVVEYLHFKWASKLPSVDMGDVVFQWREPSYPHWVPSEWEQITGIAEGWQNGFTMRTLLAAFPARV